MARKKLGEMLIEAGVLDEHTLRSALADQRRWGRTLGRTLIEMNLIAEDELVRVLGKQLNIESVDLDKLKIAKTVLDLVPADLARQHHVMPFAQPMKFLDVAMVDPTNMGVLDELRIRTQLNIRPYLGGPRQIERAIENYYGPALGHRREISIAIDGADTFEADAYVPSATTRRDRRPTRQPIPDPSEGLRPFPRTMPPPLSTAPIGEIRDAEINALQVRLSKLEALVARDEEVLRKLLSLLIDKGVATRDEILERLQ